MKFTETKLKGAYIIELDPIYDDRGFFARSFCQKEFQAYKLKINIVQCNISHNKKKGTLRGMHFQVPPKGEEKLVRCSRGSIYDVIIDLNPKSQTYCKWVAVELTAENHKMLYIPKNFAHGFQTLEDNTEVFYHMFEFYSPKQARGVCWDDPAFNIKWPIPNPIISKNDRYYPLFDKVKYETSSNW